MTEPYVRPTSNVPQLRPFGNFTSIKSKQPSPANCSQLLRRGVGKVIKVNRSTDFKLPTGNFSAQPQDGGNHRIFLCALKQKNIPKHTNFLTSTSIYTPTRKFKSQSALRSFQSNRRGEIRNPSKKAMLWCCYDSRRGNNCAKMCITTAADGQTFAVRCCLATSLAILGTLQACGWLCSSNHQASHALDLCFRRFVISARLVI